jgi:hypothetical protein
MVALGLFVLLPTSVALAQGQGDGNAMTPVGMWDFQIVDDASGITHKVLVTFHFGGTATAIGTIDPLLSLHASWEKTGSRTFVVSWYSLLTDPGTGEHFGYIKSIVENELVDKDTIEGRTESWLLIGTDPFDPIDMILLGTSHDTGSRLKPEGPA